MGERLPRRCPMSREGSQVTGRRVSAEGPPRLNSRYKGPGVGLCLCVRLRNHRETRGPGQRVKVSGRGAVSVDQVRPCWPLAAQGNLVMHMSRPIHFSVITLLLTPYPFMFSFIFSFSLGQACSRLSPALLGALKPSTECILNCF